MSDDEEYGEFLDVLLPPEYAELFGVQFQSNITPSLINFLNLIYTDTTRCAPVNREHNFALFQRAVRELKLPKPKPMMRKPSKYCGNGYLVDSDRLAPRLKCKERIHIEGTHPP